MSVLLIMTGTDSFSKEVKQIDHFVLSIIALVNLYIAHIWRTLHKYESERAERFIQSLETILKEKNEQK